MKVVFFGTPDFAVPSFRALCEKHEVAAVVTQPDKPRGRKGEITFCPVKQAAVELGVPVFQFAKVRAEGVEILRNIGADVFVTCAYGQILSQEIIDIPPHGILNVHASLLPKYRGAAPIQWAILNGDEYTGVTIMKTEAGVDTGDILISRKTPIGKEETAGSLFDRLSVLGSQLIVEALALVESGKATFTPQDDSAATTVRMLTKQDGLIDWSDTPENIVNRVRAMDPWPGAFTFYKGTSVKIWKAERAGSSGLPAGTVVASDKKNGIIIAANGGDVKITQLQWEGAKRLPSEVFLLGRRFETGSRMGADAPC